jgi:hypothetical protein
VGNSYDLGALVFETAWEQLEEKGFGWELALEDEQQYVAVLETLAKLSRIARDDFGASSREFAARHVHEEVAIEANRRMFLEAFAGQGKEHT